MKQRKSPGSIYHRFLLCGSLMASDRTFRLLEETRAVKKKQGYCNSYEWALSVTVPLTGWSSQNTTGQRPFIRITAPCRFFRERDFAFVFFASRGGDSFLPHPSEGGNSFQDEPAFNSLPSTNSWTS
ncbi:hypothetical protein CEXT_690431 [Caerostris extrusa]|uniref:Uncharacterized protein n=1 Tax=Caerostris extrusa TaxID=172846 RepID=A0AAV4MKN0_CAEEX|nr:hypothetical protein CEXT_690431 [Caerostris extrusa]